MPAFLLFLVFLVLKLTEVIDWSWLWVTAPLWAGLALMLVIGIVGGGIVGLFAAIAAAFRK